MSTEVAARTGLDRYVPAAAIDWEVTAKGRDWQELDASLCFVDISGFTNLSERLARRGRIGAEELTDVLSYVFGKMLEVSYLHGGSLLKFGGDALLLMFSGHEHALRAASAAVEMRGVLKDAEDYETSVGRLRLRMSVGIHSGMIDLFRADGSHQELVIAGPGATTTTAMEKAAEAGEIVVSEGTRNRLPDGSAPKRKEGGWILNWRKPRCEPIETVSRAVSSHADVNRWVPSALCEFLQAATPEPEHRIVSVGFIRFCDVDRTVTSEGPAVAASRIAQTMTIIQEAADDEGVTFLATDINEDGGKVILVAGAPVAREDDEGRLLRTMRRIVDAAPPLELHIGVNQGHVFAGEIGTRYRATYTIIGDTVNLAARLAAAAPANAIYATTSILDNTGILFDSEPIEPFHVKGKEQPVHAYSVGDAIGERAVDTEGELPFVGRDGELSQVTKAIFDTSDGKGTVLTIVGETGSGKSRLVREACLICSAVRAISIRSEPYGASSPYRPLRDVFRSLLQIERASNDEMAAELFTRITAIDSELLPYLPFVGDVSQIEVPSTDTVDAIEPRFRRDRLGDSVIRLLGHLLDTPTVFDVEDAQWMDDASADLMGRIAAETDHRPWTVLVSRRGRDDGFIPGAGDVLELGGLSPEHAESLVVAATANAPLRPHDIDAIVSRSGGNPLFLEEILSVARDTGSIADLPESLGSVVGTTIDALPPLARRILRYSSVLGRSFSTSILNEILADEGLRLDSATRRTLRRFLVPDGEGRLRFSNAMVRDVAYDSLSFRRRRELHLRAARVTEARSDDPDAAADILSLHYSEGGDAGHTWHYARIAGDRARDAFANIEASAHYQRALDSARHVPDAGDADKSKVWTALGDVRELSGTFDEALDAYRRATSLSNDPIDVARLAEKRARVRERSGRYSLALREITGGYRTVSDVHSIEAGRIRARLSAFAASVRLAQGKLKEAMRQATRAAEEAEETGERDALARAYSMLDVYYRWSGQPDKAVYGTRALAIYEELGDLNGQGVVNGNMGVEAYFDGRWADSIEHYGKSRDAFRKTGNEVQAVYAESNLAEILVNQGRTEEAKPMLEGALRVMLASDWLDGASFVQVQLARVMSKEGDLEAALGLFNKAQNQLLDLGETRSIAELVVYQAECLLDFGRPEEALAALNEAEAVVGEESAVHSAGMLRARGLALMELGDLIGARGAIESGLSVAESQGLAYEIALLLIAQARLVEAEGGAAGETLSKGLRMLDELGVITHPELADIA
jgi:class 3 adenylate cyclase/tetratricopeptide (TPR) repeat protein